MATRSSVLAWRIPGTVEPRGLPSVGLHRVGQDWCNLAAARQWQSLSATSVVVAQSLSGIQLSAIPCNAAGRKTRSKDRNLKNFCVQRMSFKRAANTEKDKCNIVSFICVIFKKWYKWTYMQNRNPLADIEGKLMVTKKEEGEKGIKIRSLGL